MDEESTNGEIKIYIKDNFGLISVKDKELFITQMDQDYKVIGERI
jgi:hypothetical protein